MTLTVLLILSQLLQALHLGAMILLRRRVGTVMLLKTFMPRCTDCFQSHMVTFTQTYWMSIMTPLHCRFLVVLKWSLPGTNLNKESGNTSGPAIPQTKEECLRLQLPWVWASIFSLCPLPCLCAVLDCYIHNFGLAFDPAVVDLLAAFLSFCQF